MSAGNAQTYEHQAQSVEDSIKMQKQAEELEKCRKRLAERKKWLAQNSNILAKRSKSADAPRSKHETAEFSNRTPSLINLNDVKEHAIKKMKRTMEKFSSKFEKIPRKNQKSMLDQLKKEVLDPINVFNSGKSCDDVKNHKVMLSMLECGVNLDMNFEKTNESAFGRIRTLNRENVFQNHRGGIEETITLIFDEFGHIISGSSISIVMNEYYNFEQYKKEKLREARDMIQERLTPLKINENRPYADLIRTYENVFKFNLCLLEHLFNLISKHVFNPYSIYHAENNQDINFIRNQLTRFKDSLFIVMNSFFNMEPLKRQIEELDQIKKHLSPEDLKCALASLSRYAIERIRVPRTAEIRLNQFLWVNSADKHRESLDFFRFHMNDTIPEDFDEGMFLSEAKKLFFSEDDVKIQCTQVVHNYRNPVQALLEAFYCQNQYFYQQLENFMPNGYIDPIMKAYYQHQSFLRIWNILKRRTHCLTAEDVQNGSDVSNAMMFSAIISNPKIEHDAVFAGHMLDQLYKQFSKVEAKPLPITPSYIGTTFVCFEREIFISAVREAEVLIDSKYPIENRSCVRDGEELSEILYPTCKIGLLVNPETSSLSIIFKSEDQVDKDDRLAINLLEQGAVKPTIDWSFIKENVINPAYNKLKAIMDERIRVDPNHGPLGRLENLEAPMGPFEEETEELNEEEIVEEDIEVESESMDPASSSDTEHEEDDEEMEEIYDNRIHGAIPPEKRTRHN